MSKKDFKLVPYDSTIYDLLIRSLKGNYFQNKSNPNSIIQFLETDGIYHIDNNQFTVWLPLKKNFGKINLEEFDSYALISKAQVEEYIQIGQNLEEVVLHKEPSRVMENIQWIFDHSS